MLVRPKKLTVETAAAAPDWQAVQPAGDPEIVGVRLNSAFRAPRDRSAYPVRLTVSVRLHYVNSIGSPVLPYPAELAAVEDAVTWAAAERPPTGAVLVAVTTKLTSVEFLLYAVSGHRAAEAREMVRAAVDGHPLTSQIRARSPLGRLPPAHQGAAAGPARPRAAAVLPAAGRGHGVRPLRPLVGGGGSDRVRRLDPAVACPVLGEEARPAAGGGHGGKAAAEPASGGQRGRRAIWGWLFAFFAAVLTTLWPGASTPGG